jgi:hypothetical protein
MFDLRVEKERSKAMLTNGTSVTGYMFVSAGSPSHQGRERIKDLLNAEHGFFPFEVQDSEGAEVAMFHRDHVMFVTLSTHDEPRQDPGYDVAVARDVSLLLADGTRLTGRVRVYQPSGRDRLSDYARNTDSFLYLEDMDRTYIINARHIVELRETRQS